MNDGYFNDFRFLINKYQHGFFTKFVNRYLIHILEGSLDENYLAEESTDMLLFSLLETVDGHSEGFIFDSFALQIYSDLNIPEVMDLKELNGSDIFFIWHQCNYLSWIATTDNKKRSSLATLVKLIVIQNHCPSGRHKYPRLIEATTNGVKFCTQQVVKKTIEKYKDDFLVTATRLDRQQKSGCTHASIAKDHIDQINVLIADLRKYLTYELGMKLTKLYQEYSFSRNTIGRR